MNVVNKMVQWHLKSKRKPTGGLLKKHRKKKKMDRGRDFIPTHIGERKMIKVRVRGGDEKFVLLSDQYANVSVNGEVKRVKILEVVKNPANPQFERHNVITKGAIIKTELGEARVTSRPGQDGVINAVLIEEKSSK